MSSQVKHMKRSHRSEQRKNAAFRAQTVKAYRRTANDPRKNGIYGRLAAMLHRKAMKPVMLREAKSNEDR